MDKHKWAREGLHDGSSKRIQCALPALSSWPSRKAEAGSKARLCCCKRFPSHCPPFEECEPGSTFFKDPPSVLWFVLTWRFMTSKAANLTRAQFTFQLRREHVIDACETRDRFLCDLSATREKESETFRLKYTCSSPALLPLILMNTHSLVAWFPFGHLVHR